jgi:hypothetical protein
MEHLSGVISLQEQHLKNEFNQRSQAGASRSARLLTCAGPLALRHLYPWELHEINQHVGPINGGSGR